MISAEIVSDGVLANKCPMCGTEATLKVPKSKVDAILSGAANIQYLLPDYNPAEREFLITGYCPDCQNRIFGSNYSYTNRWKKG